MKTTSARDPCDEVRSFEILRCLGADLLDNDTKGARCWNRGRRHLTSCGLAFRFGGETAAARGETGLLGKHGDHREHVACLSAERYLSGRSCLMKLRVSSSRGEDETAYSNRPV